MLPIRYSRPLKNFAFMPVDDMLERFFQESDAQPNKSGIQFQEERDAYRVEVDLPGVRKEDVKLQVENNVVSVEAVRKVKKGGEESETRYSHCFAMPIQVDAEKIKAGLDAGVLTITLPKKEETKARTLAIDIK